MAKGYWIALVTVTDPERYSGYQQHAPAAFAEYGARFLARGGAAVTLEGDDWQRHQSARENREGACTAHVVITEGLSGG